MAGQLRLLLAGSDAAGSDLAAAAAMLQKHNVLVTVAKNQQQAIAALPRNDVAVCQVGAAGAASDAVDAFALLRCSSNSQASCPIAVMVSGHSTDIMKEAVQLGALDILQAPISEQGDRLHFHAEKWKHTLLLRKQKDSGDLSSGQASECFSLDIPAPGINSPLGGDSLDELLGSATSSGTVFDGDWAQSDALAAEIMPNVFGSVEDSISGRQPFDMCFSALASCEADLLFDQLADDTLQAQHSGSCDSSLSCLPPMSRQTSLATCGVSTMGKRKSEEFLPMSSDDLKSELTDDARNKKLKVEWTAELHTVFVKVVERIGVDKAVPSQILTEMGSHGAGLTRQNIASHLQKYRNRSRAGLPTGVSTVPASRADAAALSNPLPVLCPSPLPMMPAVPCWPRMGAAAMAPAYSLPAGGFAAWPTMAQPPPVLLASSATAVSQPSPQLLASLQTAMRQPMGKLPIGLKLDANAVMKDWKAAAQT